jgi:hypothetical protein
MFGKLKEVARSLRPMNVRERQEAYLSDAVDLYDLEYRMRQIDRGEF